MPDGLPHYYDPGNRTCGRPSSPEFIYRSPGSPQTSNISSLTQSRPRSPVRAMSNPLGLPELGSQGSSGTRRRGIQPRGGAYAALAPPTLSPSFGTFDLLGSLPPLAPLGGSSSGSTSRGARADPLAQYGPSGPPPRMPLPPLPNERNRLPPSHSSRSNNRGGGLADCSLDLPPLGSTLYGGLGGLSRGRSSLDRRSSVGNVDDFLRGGSSSSSNLGSGPSLMPDRDSWGRLPKYPLEQPRRGQRSGSNAGLSGLGGLPPLKPLNMGSDYSSGSLLYPERSSAGHTSGLNSSSGSGSSSSTTRKGKGKAKGQGTTTLYPLTSDTSLPGYNSGDDDDNSENDSGRVPRHLRAKTRARRNSTSSMSDGLQFQMDGFESSSRGRTAGTGRSSRKEGSLSPLGSGLPSMSLHGSPSSFDRLGGLGGLPPLGGSRPLGGLGGLPPLGKLPPLRPLGQMSSGGLPPLDLSLSRSRPQAIGRGWTDFTPSDPIDIISRSQQARENRYRIRHKPKRPGSVSFMTDDLPLYKPELLDDDDDYAGL